MGHGASGAQSSRGCVSVEMGLAGQVCGSQVRVDVARVRGAIVMEGVRGLSGDGGCDVGLLAPMTSISLGYHVLLGLEEEMIEGLNVSFIDPELFCFFLEDTLLFMESFVASNMCV